MAFTMATLMAALCASAAWAGEHHGLPGKMSMWSSTQDTIVGYKSEGSACKYADKEMGGLAAPTAKSPYVPSRNYCAVNRGMFGGGEICGACYRLTYHGDHEQGLGRPGSQVVQIVDSGSWATFDCHMTAFHTITDYDTGFFPITYEKVPCETSGGGAVAGVLHYDYYFSKFVFSNLRYPVKTASLFIGGKEYPMKLIGGFWSAWTGPAKGSASFKLTEEDGEQVSLSGCFGGWESRHTGDGCSGGHSNLALKSSVALSLSENPTAPGSKSNLRGHVQLTNASAANNTENETAELLFP